MEIFKNEGISGDGVNTPLGIDTTFWTPYNETVLYSASSLSYTVNLSEPASAFSRLKIGMVSRGEGRQYIEIETPSSVNQVYTFHCIWGGNSAAVQDVYTKYKFNGSYSQLVWANNAAWKNVGWAVNTTAAFNGATTASTGEMWCRCPVYEVIGINRKEQL